MKYAIALAVLMGTVAALEKTPPQGHAQDSMEKLAGSLEHLEADVMDLDKSAATPPDYIISYFRHSFKTSSARTSAFNLKIDTATEEAKVNTAAKVADHFGSWTAHLAGQSKAKCPSAIGKMLREWMGKDENEELPFNLWASKYHRVLGTGLQMSKGLQGEAGFDDMPGPADKCAKFANGNCKEPADKEEAARRYLTEKLTKAEPDGRGGQVSAWMVEHLRFYPDSTWKDANQKSPDKEYENAASVAAVNSKSGHWYTPKQADCSKHGYHSEWDQEAWGTGSYDYYEHTKRWKAAHPQCVKFTDGEVEFTQQTMEPFMSGMVHDTEDFDEPGKTDYKEYTPKSGLAGIVATRNCKPGKSCVILPGDTREAWMKWVRTNVKAQVTTLSKLLDNKGEFQKEWPEEVQTWLDSKKTGEGPVPKPRWGEWLKSPKEYGEEKTGDECVPGFSWDYAGYVGGTFGSSHFVNEISIQPEGCKWLADGTNYCTYANIVPECKGTPTEPKHLSDVCIAAIDVLYGIGWPGTYRAHALGYKNDIAVPSIALILGALLKRAYEADEKTAKSAAGCPKKFLQLMDKYNKMLEKAGPPETAGNYEGMPSEGDQPTPLEDEKKKVLLMSSHDITTNLMRITMQMAFGDKVQLRTTFNDLSPTMMDNQIAYSAMFSYAVYGTELQVKNFNMGLRQSAYGCAGEKGKLEHTHMADLFAEKMEVSEFVSKMAATLYPKAKIGGKQATTMHSSVTEFLELAKDCGK